MVGRSIDDIAVTEEHSFAHRPRFARGLRNLSRPAPLT
jgi:hypothetical protein